MRVPRTFSWWRFLWWSLALRPKALRSYSASSWGFLASFFRFRSKWSSRKPWLRSKTLGRQRGAARRCSGGPSAGKYKIMRWHEVRRRAGCRCTHRFRASSM